MIRQDELSVERFVETIKELVLDGNEKLQEMQSAMAKMGKPEAAKSLALQLLNLSAAKS